MRLARIFDPHGHLCPDAGARLLALQQYPEDVASQRQFTMLLNDEAARADEAGPQKYQPSQFSESVETVVGKGMGQRAAAGLVTLSFHFMQIKTRKVPTMYAATKLAANTLQLAKQNDPTPLKRWTTQDGAEIEEPVLVAASREDIQKRFKEFNSVGHIMAAQFCFPDAFPVLPWPESIRTGLPELARTAAAFEVSVIDANPTYFPNPWRIAPGMGEQIGRLQPLPLPADLLTLFDRAHSCSRAG